MEAKRSETAIVGTIGKRVGVLLMATGIAFLTGGFQNVSLWLIETFPQFGAGGVRDGWGVEKSSGQNLSLAPSQLASAMGQLAERTTVMRK
jgi:hypothetical protein